MLSIDIHGKLGDFALDMSLNAGLGVTALFGRSGSGKTSLINMVAGLYTPHAGQIILGNRSLFDAKAGINLTPEKRRIGYVFQDARLFPHLTVEKNLRFGESLIKPSLRRIKFDDVVGILGIEHLLDRRPANLSGGEKSRVGIGRALLTSPELLLMDEPLAALDHARKSDVLPYLARLNKQFEIPCLYVSHSIDEVLQLADHLAIIDQGRIKAFGGVEDIMGRAELRPLTGRYAAGSVIRGRVMAQDNGLGITQLDLGQGQSLSVARVDLPKDTLVRVRIHAREVTIATKRPENISVRNILEGRILEVRPAEGFLYDVIMDHNGMKLWAQISAHAQAELGLTPGMSAYSLVKALTIARADVIGR